MTVPETMTQVEEINTQVQETATPKKKRTFLNGFLHFLMYGGWLLIVIVVLGAYIAISVMTGSGQTPPTP